MSSSRRLISRRGRTSRTSFRLLSRTTWAGCRATRFSARCFNEYSNNALWHEWIPQHRTLADAELWLNTCEERDDLVRYRQFTAYVQWVAWRQWGDVREYADTKGVRLIGDIPFGISRYSADVWSEHEAFRPDVVGWRTRGTVLQRRGISPALGPELGHSALRLADASRAKLCVVAAADHGDEPDFSRLPDRSRARLFSHLQLPVDAATEWTSMRS